MIATVVFSFPNMLFVLVCSAVRLCNSSDHDRLIGLGPGLHVLFIFFYRISTESLNCLAYDFFE